MSCKMCGMCCKSIGLQQNYEYLKANAIGHVYDPTNDIDFIYKNWSPISREEAEIINPYMKNWSGVNFYTCNLLVDNKCSIHGLDGSDKPHVCTGFPFYRHTPTLDYLFYTEDCGYKDDIPGLIEAKEKQDIEIIEKYGPGGKNYVKFDNNEKA